MCVCVCVCVCMCVYIYIYIYIYILVYKFLSNFKPAHNKEYRRHVQNNSNVEISQETVKTLTTKTEFTITPITTQYPNTHRQSQHMQPKIAFQKASAHTVSTAHVDRQFLETYTNYVKHL